MANSKLEDQLQFLFEADKLKTVQRRSSLIYERRMENSAEHSWHVALMALVLAEYAEEPVDLGRVVAMLLIHDLVEIDAGDTYCYDEQGNADKAEREETAAQRIFGLLPSGQAKTLHALWQEFEARKTPEARFANAVDRIMPLFHNYFNQGGSWRRHGVEATQVQQRVAPVRDGSEALWLRAQMLIADSIRQGFLTPGRQAVPLADAD